MPEHPVPQHVLLSLPGHYDLPADLKFVGLVRPKDTETARIRFSRGTATILDIPLSAESLCALGQSLIPLHGVPAQEIPHELEDLRKTGKLRFEE